MAEEAPEILLCSPTFYAMFRATLEFSGRDRRRIRREQLKAFAKARKLVNKEIK